MTLSHDGSEWVAETAGNMLSRTIRAKQIIDCSGEAVAVRLADGECIKEAVRQPATLEFNFTGFDIDNIDVELLENKFQAAVTSGELKREDYCYFDKRFIEYLRNGGGGNFQHLLQSDGDNSQSQTESNISGRQRLLKRNNFV